MKIKTALLSVSDKEGLVPFARELEKLGIRILSTGGTARVLSEAGITVTQVSDYTGSPEILEGRVKTLHPKIHAGILARLGESEHRKTLEEMAIEPIGLVAVNLYPFAQTVARADVAYDDAIEQIDVGGPTMVRAAAKNSDDVTVIVDPADYTPVLAELRTRNGQTELATRRRLALKAFEHTAAYDSSIASWMTDQLEQKDGLPSAVGLFLRKLSDLRYGENPHQRGALYAPGFGYRTGLPAAVKLQGKELSFNNYVDLDAAWALAQEFAAPFCGIIKHNNPCGAAIGESPLDAFGKALATDPVSAFGSVISFNREVDEETAIAMKPLFVEALIAPSYSQAALEVLGSKQNLRVMRMEGPARTDELDWRRIEGGFLLQDRDVFFIEESNLQVVTQRKPAREEIRDLLFAWSVCKHVKSNAIIFARGGQTIGIGAGQMSRVDSVELAARKSRLTAQGGVMASDAFFPFRDGIDAAARSGIRAVVQPGGSVKDSEVISAADEHGMSMVFTGIRHFRH